MTETKYCSERVTGYGQYGLFHLSYCRNIAVVEREGRLYCRVHDPEYIKVKEAKKKAKRIAEGCPKCGAMHLRIWWSFCPMCGTVIKR